MLVAVGLCQLVGFIGAIFTVSSISTWYVFLNKPSWNPPSWIFGPVWTVLYTLMGVSLYRVWSKGLTKPKVRSAVMWFGVHLVFNALWSIIFFGQRNISLALVEILALLVLIVVVMVKFYKIDKVSTHLLLPYLVWTSFATFLTYTIWSLNP